MSDESICYFKGVVSILSLLFGFIWRTLLANNADPDQMPHYVASDQGLHCLPMTLLQVNGLKTLIILCVSELSSQRLNSVFPL